MAEAGAYFVSAMESTELPCTVREFCVRMLADCLQEGAEGQWVGDAARFASACAVSLDSSSEPLLIGSTLRCVVAAADPNGQVEWC